MATHTETQEFASVSTNLASDSKRIEKHVVFVVTTAESTRFAMKGLLRYLRGKNWNITVISSPGQDLNALGERENVDVIPIPMSRRISPMRDLISVFRLFRAFRRLQPDIVNVGTPKAGLLGGIAGVLCRVPHRVYTLKGLRLETSTGIPRRLLSIFEKIACACAHHVVCVSHSLRAVAVREKLLPTNKAIVLGNGSSNGVDLRPILETDGEALRSKYSLPGSALVVGYVGRIARAKGISHLIRAFHDVTLKYNDAYLVLIGANDATDPVEPEIQEQITSNPHIKTLGFVESPQQFYAMMDVVAFPTFREGLPKVPLEAAVHSIPTVGFLATGMTDAIVDGATGKLVACGDESALREAILDYFDNPDLRQAHGAEARKMVETKFAQEVVWKNWHNFYRQIVS